MYTSKVDVVKLKRSSNVNCGDMIDSWCCNDYIQQNGTTSAPLLVWLQGGPGDSSLFGLFNENGPIAVDETGMAYKRNVTWNLDYHILYIDNPVSLHEKLQLISVVLEATRNTLRNFLGEDAPRPPSFHTYQHHSLFPPPQLKISCINYTG